MHKLEQEVGVLCQDGIFGVFFLRDLTDELQKAEEQSIALADRMQPTRQSLPMHAYRVLP